MGDVSKIADLTFDPNNARVRTAKGEKMIQDSLNEVGAARSIVIDENNVILAGNGTVEAAGQIGISRVRVIEASGDEIIAVRRSGLTDEQKKKLAYYDNRTGDEAKWDMEQVARDLLGGYDFLDELFDDIKLPEPDQIGGDDVPDDPAEVLREKWGVEYGDLWQIGEHRILCGDSTKKEDVDRLMGGKKAQLIHADPPYGMGKEGEGVVNDNLYREKLDAFQMEWWKVFRPHTDNNGSAYIWGNAEDLWRLWYKGGLKESERLTFRNEIVWYKGVAQGMASEKHRMYPTATERCLFFMIGEQGFNNNADNYWDGWDQIRGYLKSEADRVGLDAKKTKEICGVGMYSHWFTESQWVFIPENHYKALKREYDGFKREYDELKREFYSTRAYFDNTHDKMMDVWQYSSVIGEDRHGHATPKPVDMIQRCIKSSSPDGGIVVEPFSGSGTTLVAAHNESRTCYAMEIDPAYVAVCLERMAQLGYDPEKTEG